MSQVYFITGTDTDVGKTKIATALLARARLQGLTTAAVKPVASGAQDIDGILQNEDALALKAQCSVPLSYAEINPIVFKPAIAPHIAAQQAGELIVLDKLAVACQHVINQKADLTIIEGAGGWRVPVNDNDTLADLVQQLNIPVILVVGVKLGCINHALLTAEAILRDGLTLAGWVANCAMPHMHGYAENIATLKKSLPTACLGEVPYLPQASAQQLANFLHI